LEGLRLETNGCILWLFGIFIDILGYFMTIWYILYSFGAFFRGNPVPDYKKWINGTILNYYDSKISFCKAKRYESSLSFFLEWWVNWACRIEKKIQIILFLVFSSDLFNILLRATRISSSVVSWTRAASKVRFSFANKRCRNREQLFKKKLNFCSKMKVRFLFENEKFGFCSKMKSLVFFRKWKFDFCSKIKVMFENEIVCSKLKFFRSKN
jgi:hypothetical protein